MLRRATKGDIPAIEEMHTRAGYSFCLDLDKFLFSWVTEIDGKIVAWAGAQLQPEIVAVMDPDFGSPHQRMKLFARMHRPLAEDVQAAGYEKVFATLDPKYPGFGRHLKKLGWFEGWSTMWVYVQTILGKNVEKPQ